jgi:hypothetical protein
VSYEQQRAEQLADLVLSGRVAGEQVVRESLGWRVEGVVTLVGALSADLAQGRLAAEPTLERWLYLLVWAYPEAGARLAATFEDARKG